MITKLKGDDLGVLKNENHALYEWNGKGRVVISATMMGEGLSCHFAADKKALRELEPACNEFCEWAFKAFQCKMIIAMIKRKSIERIIKRCGFVHLFNCKGGVIYGKTYG